MLNVDGNDIDLSIFESGAQLPGTYYVDIMLNGKLVDTKEMEFSRERNKDGEFVLSSCLTQSMLNRYGVKVGDYPELFVNSSNGKVCGDLSVIPGAFSYFDFYNQQLNLSIPNVALYPKYKGIASEELWDNGINAFLMNYQANAQINQYRNKKIEKSVLIGPGSSLV
ncbi:FimD/PapC N-terminal domain-containing protein (plasmid) [Escherichia coli]